MLRVPFLLILTAPISLFSSSNITQSALIPPPICCELRVGCCDLVLQRLLKKGIHLERFLVELVVVSVPTVDRLEGTACGFWLLSSVSGWT